MMKKIIALTALLLTGALLLSGCAAGAGKMDTVYRGEVVAISEEDGSILVEQLPGYNYGQAGIRFLLNDKTKQELGDTLAVGAFVEVHYDGRLTRSIPAQGNADSVTVIASFSEGIIQNGTILSVLIGKDGYSISLLPLGEEKKDDLSNTITLTVHMFALEGLTADDLVEGAKVCAVTYGIALESSPPMMQVVALLPYTE